MLLLAKVALAMGGTVAAAGAYTFHDGVMRVQVDDDNGTHVHIWAPAAIVPMAMHFVPPREFHKMGRDAQDFLPTLRVLAKELEKYPNSEFVEVGAPGTETHVKVRTQGSKIIVDVVDHKDNVHVTCPLAMVRDMVDALQMQIQSQTGEPGA